LHDGVLALERFDAAVAAVFGGGEFTVPFGGLLRGLLRRLFGLGFGLRALGLRRGFGRPLAPLRSAGKRAE
jgi:hypothetical protein